MVTASGPGSSGRLCFDASGALRCVYRLLLLIGPAWLGHEIKRRADQVLPGFFLFGSKNFDSSVNQDFLTRLHLAQRAGVIAARADLGGILDFLIRLAIN